MITNETDLLKLVERVVNELRELDIVHKKTLSKEILKEPWRRDVQRKSPQFKKCK